MLYNKKSFFKDIIIVVFFGHLFLLAMLLLYDKGEYEQERFVINSMDNLQATVVFMPLQKHVIAKPVKTETPPTAHTEKTRSLMSLDAYNKKVKQQCVQAKQIEKAPKKIVEKVAKPVPVQKVIEKKVDAVPKKESVKQPVNKVVTEKIEKKIIAQTKQDVKKASEKAAQLEKVPVVQKVEPKIEEPIVAQAPVEQPVIAEPVITPSESVQPESVEPQVQTPVVDAIDPDQVSFIGRKDLDLLQIKELIHTQVALYYKPPVGMHKTAICELKVLVGADAKAEKVIVCKSSGSMANDVCARAALLQVVFPKEVIGKEIVIALGQ